MTVEYCTVAFVFVGFTGRGKPRRDRLVSQERSSDSGAALALAPAGGVWRARHDRYGKASNPERPEAREANRVRPTHSSDKDLPAKSNRLESQDAGVIGSQCFPVFAMLLSMISNFRIQAVRASFLGFPAARSRW